jgi:hypothetical protein
VVCLGPDGVVITVPVTLAVVGLGEPVVLSIVVLPGPVVLIPVVLAGPVVLSIVVLAGPVVLSIVVLPGPVVLTPVVLPCPVVLCGPGLVVRPVTPVFSNEEPSGVVGISIDSVCVTSPVVVVKPSSINDVVVG